MTLSEGARKYAEEHGTTDREKAMLEKAYRAGYFQSTDNWCTKARD